VRIKPYSLGRSISGPAESDRYPLLVASILVTFADLEVRS